MSLDDFFNDPEYANLLGDPKKSKQTATTIDDRILESFNLVKEFHDKNGRLPERSGDFSEKQIFFKYNGIIQDPKVVESLREHDTQGILVTKEYTSMDDALEDDSLKDLLGGGGALDMFTLKHVKAYEAPEYVARRKKCENFEDYEHLFEQCHSDLNIGRRTLYPFKTSKLSEGNFYVLKGVVCYIAEIGKLIKDENGCMNGRLLVIFENGTQSDLLLRSLTRSLNIEKGLTVSSLEEDALEPLTQDDVITGSVYVLKSKSTDEKVSSLEDFYKIGFTKDSVEKRISNAENESTYLYAPVEVVAVYKLANISAKGIETLLHKFFANSNLDIKINGHSPREWFKVPIGEIDKAISLLASRQIIHYQYNHNTKKIELRQ